MRARDSESVWATVGPVPAAEDTPQGDTLPERVVAVIKNPLVTGDELWVALEFLAPRLGIHMKRDDEAATQPARPLVRKN